MPKTKTKIEIDPENRLWFRTGKSSGLPDIMQILTGDFVTDKDNDLSYQVKTPMDGSAPKEVKLAGKWKLDKNLDLQLALDGERQANGNKLTLKGKLSDVQSDSLAFEYDTKDEKGTKSTQTVRLNGQWQVDEKNRLLFAVKRQQGPSDQLILGCGWELDKQNRITYSYTKTALKTREKIEHVFTLSGYWDITDSHRLSYLISENNITGPAFKVGVGKACEGSLEYQIGVEGSVYAKTLKLTGRWRVNDTLGLVFEMPCEDGRIRSMIFGASFKFNKDFDLDFRIRNETGKDLGIEATLSKRILDGSGEVFLQGFASEQRQQIMAGVAFKF